MGSYPAAPPQGVGLNSTRNSRSDFAGPANAKCPMTRNDVAMSNRRWRQTSIIMIAKSPSAGRAEASLGISVQVIVRRADEVGTGVSS